MQVMNSFTSLVFNLHQIYSSDYSAHKYLDNRKTRQRTGVAR